MINNFKQKRFRLLSNYDNFSTENYFRKHRKWPKNFYPTSTLQTLDKEIPIHPNLHTA